MIANGKLYGVLNGSLTEQQKLNSAELHRLSDNLKQFSDDCQKNHMFKAFDMTDDYSIRIITERPEDTLTIVVMYRMWIRKQTPEDNAYMYDMRFSIGIGEANANYSDIMMMSGCAFIFSKWEYDKMKFGEKIRIGTCFSDSDNHYLNLFAKCMSGIVSTMSKRQSSICYEMLAVDNVKTDNVIERVYAKNNRMTRYMKSIPIKLIRKTLQHYADKILNLTSSIDINRELI